MRGNNLFSDIYLGLSHNLVLYLFGLVVDKISKDYLFIHQNTTFGRMRWDYLFIHQYYTLFGRLLIRNMNQVLINKPKLDL